MWGLILTVGVVIVVALFPAVRCAVTHPLHVLWYGVLESFTYLRHKDYNCCHTGDLDIYCGYFGSGKTLSLVHKVTGLYERYDGKTVWCPRRGKFVTQRVLILSNVALAVPYQELRSLAQIVAASKVNQAYDCDHCLRRRTGRPVEQPVFPGQHRPDVFVYAAVLPPLLHKPVRQCPTIRPRGQADARCHAERHPMPQDLAPAMQQLVRCLGTGERHQPRTGPPAPARLLVRAQ